MPTRRYGVGLKADTVVLDQSSHSSFGDDHRDAGRSSTGVAGDVGQRFLDDTVDDRLDLGREPVFPETVRGERDGCISAGGHVLGQTFQRRDQSDVVKDGRPKIERQFARPAQRVGDERSNIIGTSSGIVERDLVTGQRRFDEPEAEQHRGQGLTDVVVEIA